MGSRMHLHQIQHGPPLSYKDDVRAYKREYADSLDAQDPLRHLRKEFVIPSKKDLTRKELPDEETCKSEENDAESCIYLCGNSLGLQPRRTSVLIDMYLKTWGMKGVNGHFQPVENSPLEPWLDIDAAASKQMSHVISALPSEIAIMGTLTANLHFLLASFYRPTEKKYKILLEGKAFPSDHYAVESQIIHHKLDPANAMILISSSDLNSPCISTSEIYKAIDTHAETTAVLLLPGVQFYTGQFLDIKQITAYAQEKGIIVGWDLAHAVGNVELALHDWNVDFAVWCSYKYLNSGPGAIGGLFVHERHGQVNKAGQFKPRLSGWWGAEKGSRFRMDNHFIPIPGAAGYQLSNPSALDLTAFQASMSVFQETDMRALRKKSKDLTGYLEHLLLKYPIDAPKESKPWKIITPLNPDERGAQLSILLEPGLLHTVMEDLSDRSVVIDERKPDVIRVAPAPLYNSFSDVWLFVDAFRQATARAMEKRQKAAET